MRHEHSVPARISVLVRIELDGSRVDVLVAGRLTGVNQQGLRPVVRRALALTPGTAVTVDLTAAHVEDGAVEVLLQGLGAPATCAVHVLLPPPVAGAAPR
ncbi:hypothetical protein [Kocuria sp. KH4]